VERAVRVSIFPYERVFELFEQRSVDAHAELLDRALAARNDDRSVIIRNAPARFSIDALHVELKK
jgi:hypothetical protein